MHSLNLVPVLVLALATGACAPQMPTMGASYDGNTTLSAPVPPMAADRKVSEQDCSNAIDTSGGSLRCK